MRIIFFGTSAFAIPCLKALHENFSLLAVVSAPDRRGGRGRKQLLESPVKKFASGENIPILQPERLKAIEFLAQLEDFKADIFVVVAFRMLPEVVWRMPSLGTVNLHASLLPAYRGAAPINHAIISGEKETGLTVFRIDENIDTGDLLCRKKLKISDTETAGELHDRLALAGGGFIVECLKKYHAGGIIPIPQNQSKVSHAPKLTKDFGRLNFAESSREVFNKIRGLSPYPGAYTYLAGQEFKILGAKVICIGEINQKVPISGKIITDGRDRILIGTADGWIECKDVQLEGKKRMGVRDFLNGFKGDFPASIG